MMTTGRGELFVCMFVCLFAQTGVSRRCKPQSSDACGEGQGVHVERSKEQKQRTEAKNKAMQITRRRRKKKKKKKKKKQQKKKWGLRE